MRYTYIYVTKAYPQVCPPTAVHVETHHKHETQLDCVIHIKSIGGQSRDRYTLHCIQPRMEAGFGSSSLSA